MPCEICWLGFNLDRVLSDFGFLLFFKRDLQYGAESCFVYFYIGSSDS